MALARTVHVDYHVDVTRILVCQDVRRESSDRAVPAFLSKSYTQVCQPLTRGYLSKNKPLVSIP